jgi:hypothetical protein
MASLRKPLIEKTTIELHEGSTPMSFDPGEQYEISCKLFLADAGKMGFGFCNTREGESDHALWLETDGLHLDGVYIPLDETQLAKPVDVRLFVDHSLVEIFVDGGRYTAVRVLLDYIPENTGLKAFSDGEGAVIHDLQIWQIETDKAD